MFSRCVKYEEFALLICWKRFVCLRTCGTRWQLSLSGRSKGVSEPGGGRGGESGEGGGWFERRIVKIGTSSARILFAGFTVSIWLIKFFACNVENLT